MERGRVCSLSGLYLDKFNPSSPLERDFISKYALNECRHLILTSHGQDTRLASYPSLFSLSGE